MSSTARSCRCPIFGTLCDLGIFMNEPAEPVSSDDLVVGVDGVGSQGAGLVFNARWGRWALKWSSYSVRTLRRCAALTVSCLLGVCSYVAVRPGSTRHCGRMVHSGRGNGCGLNGT